jgi:hypothetical protein
MKDRHPELGAPELAQLREAGLRFCQPVIPHGREHTALAHEDANAASAAACGCPWGSRTRSEPLPWTPPVQP